MSRDKESVSWPGWETVRLIGRGSFGAVYEIQRDVLGDIEKAALKVISIPQNASDIDEMYSNGYDEESVTNTFKYHLKSIVAEYSMMRKLSDCPNIVTCDDVRYIQHDDGIGWDIYIKMELLTPLIKSLQSPVTEETAVKLAKDICSALVACKQENIVHRDIKPQNIFISPSGRYKLGDFGIAKTVEKTMGGTKIGTYTYMAPEVYNNKPYGSAADIYSLGLVLYWMLNERRMPFLPLPPTKLSVGMDEAARMRRLSGEQIPEPKNGGKQLKAIVMKACAYNVEDRYASAADMLRDLNRIGQAHIGTANVVPASGESSDVRAKFEDEGKTVNVFAKEDAADIMNPEPEDKTVGLFFKSAEKPSFEKPATSKVVKPAQKAEVIPAAEEDGTVGLFFKPAEKPSFEKPAASEAVKPAQKTEAIPAVEEDGTTGLFFRPAEELFFEKPAASEVEKRKGKTKVVPEEEKTAVAARDHYFSDKARFLAACCFAGCGLLEIVGLILSCFFCIMGISDYIIFVVNSIAFFVVAIMLFRKQCNIWTMVIAGVPWASWLLILLRWGSPVLHFSVPGVGLLILLPVLAVKLLTYSYLGLYQRQRMLHGGKRNKFWYLPAAIDGILYVMLFFQNAHIYVMETGFLSRLFLYAGVLMNVLCIAGNLLLSYWITTDSRFSTDK